MSETFQGRGLYNPDDVLDVVVELVGMRRAIDDLAATIAGDVIAYPRRLLVTAADNPIDFRVEAEDAFHSVKIDNPGDVDLLVSFAPGRGASAGDADEVVPARSGRILTRPYDVVSIGADRALVPAAGLTAYVTYYSRPLPPVAYSLVDRGTATAPWAVVGNVFGPDDNSAAVKVGGVYKATPPTLADGDRAALMLGLRNALAVSIFGRDANSGVNSALLSSDAVSAAANTGLFGLAMGYLFNGSSWDRARGPNVFKPFAATAVTAGTGITIWTPAAGKKFRLMGWAVSLSVAGQLIFGDNVVGTVIARSPTLAAAGLHSLGSSDLVNGILSAVANNVLKLDVTANGNVAGMVWGTEE